MLVSCTLSSQLVEAEEKDRRIMEGRYLEFETGGLRLMDTAITDFEWF